MLNFLEFIGAYAWSCLEDDRPFDQWDISTMYKLYKSNHNHSDWADINQIAEKLKNNVK